MELPLELILAEETFEGLTGPALKWAGPRQWSNGLRWRIVAAVIVVLTIWLIIETTTN